jgi:hypothetical protein
MLPEVVRILSMLQDRPSIWEKMNGLERSEIIFDGLYFDVRGDLLLSKIQSPFVIILSQQKVYQL